MGIFDSQMQFLKEQVTTLGDSLGDLQKRLAHLQAHATAGLDTISGKAIEDKVREYSEVYGEVLLGLHRDLESLRSIVQRFQSETSGLAVTMGGLSRLAQDLNEKSMSMENDLADQAKKTQRLRLLCIFSYVFAFGLMVAVWLIR